MTETFSGFPKSGLQFLRDLKENNDRDWFRERKQVYDDEVKRPMELLVLEAAAACRKRGVPVFAKDKNPVMRVYRDIRFSADKRPFKTHVGAGLIPAAGRSSLGELYLHISPDESFLAAGFWMPERPFLRAWREAMTRDPAAILRVTKALTKNKLALSEENSLRRLPRGYDRYAGSELAGLLRLTSFVTTRPLKQSECRTGELVDTVADFAAGAKPLLEYGWSLTYRPQRDILEDR